MRITSIANGSITLQLSPDACCLLWQACEAAAPQHSPDSEEGTSLSELCLEALGLMFRVAAIVGYAQWNMRPVDLVSLNRDLYAAGLIEDSAPA